MRERVLRGTGVRVRVCSNCISVNEVYDLGTEVLVSLQRGCALSLLCARMWCVLGRMWGHAPCTWIIATQRFVARRALRDRRLYHWRAQNRYVGPRATSVAMRLQAPRAQKGLRTYPKAIDDCKRCMFGVIYVVLSSRMEVWDTLVTSLCSKSSTVSEIVSSIYR